MGGGSQREAMEETDRHTELRPSPPQEVRSDATHGSGYVQKRRLSIVIRQTTTDAQGHSHTHSQIVPLLGKSQPGSLAPALA